MPIKNLMKRKESRILEFKSKVSDNIGEMMWHDYGTIMARFSYIIRWRERKRIISKIY